jgi:hypothetical protein
MALTVSRFVQVIRRQNAGLNRDKDAPGLKAGFPAYNCENEGTGRMSVRGLIRAARTLTVNDRKRLVKALVDMLAESAQEQPKRKRSLREFRGRGQHLYDGTDAQAYVNQLHKNWDDPL